MVGDPGEAAENFLEQNIMGTTNVAHLNHIVSMCVVTIRLVGYQDRRQLPGEILWFELKLKAAPAVTTCVRDEDGKDGLLELRGSLETLCDIRMTR